jgi:cell shape-determining protein MreC
MTNGKITLIILGVIFISLGFLTPGVAIKVGEILTFGILNTKKIDIQKLKEASAELKIYSGEGKNKFIPGFVYSIYPFNLKNEVSINIGSESKVRLGGAATTMDGVLVGKIISVSDKSSIIKTIFDATFELPVYIGKTSVPALLKGGPNPKITLIPKSSIVDAGSLIYSASKDFPYGLVLGEIGPIKVSGTSVFYEGELRLSYNLSDLRVLYLQND